MVQKQNKAKQVEDAKKRLLKKLDLGTLKTDPIHREVQTLVKQAHFTQAFLTQWMLVENIAIHIIRTSVVCNWCEDVFTSLKFQLGDIGFSEDSYEKKIFDPLFSKYMKARSNFEKINAEQVYKCLEKIKSDIDELQIKQLLADKVPKNLPDCDSGKLTKTVRNRRNEIIHKNGRIDRVEYEQLQPFFDYFFKVLKQIVAKGQS